METTKLVRIIQPVSPQLMKWSPRFVAGAKEGHIMISRGTFNDSEFVSLTDALIFTVQSKGFTYMEWEPRSQGGGFVAVREPLDGFSSTDLHHGKITLLSGHEIVQYRTYTSVDGMTIYLTYFSSDMTGPLEKNKTYNLTAERRMNRELDVVFYTFLATEVTV